VLDAAWVIARRDFVATVWSRTFLIFLLAPVLAIGFAFLLGAVTGQAEAEAQRPVVALIADDETVKALMAARTRLAEGTSEEAMPILRPIAAEEEVQQQAERLLADRDESYAGVFTGSLDRPMLRAPQAGMARVGNRVELLVDSARREQALQTGSYQAVTLARAESAQAGGGIRTMQRALARGAQMAIFVLTLMLATLMVTNLVEEKSNKVIEILAAAVPLDSVFLGKLMGMLGISVVGLLFWSFLGGVAIFFISDLITVPVEPAVGWPFFLLLLICYFATSYMLLGSVFLGVGGQASNVREIQTLSMPLTFAQIMNLVLAGTVIGGVASYIGWAAILFPLSSPLAMMAVAAESPLWWPHPIALIWQLLWVGVIIRIAAGMFRRTVLKSGGVSLFGWKRKAAVGNPKA
jgi:ABC-2 type transport system permease protein